MSLNRKMLQLPSLAHEDRLKSQGYEFIAGIDEAGRGALAGPVVAGAVMLAPYNYPDWLKLVRDSKELSPKKREFIFSLIQKDALAVATGIVAPEVIDSINILEATKLAMMQAIQKLPRQPQFLLIDRLILPRCSTPQLGITGGDKLCLSIACASIVAKVTRDRIMEELATTYPGYALAKHKGYGTSEHISCLRRLGPCQIHRLSFAPVKQISR